ncbi:MAG TPA: hypothetical protein VG294_05810 [Solirubrobacteraceae bacterium]|jgi:hypothetical protein|nr:hypothetical protein [Solirubrobacteraceae bacterium]
MNSDQLQRETETRVRVAPVAIIAGLLLVIAAVTGLLGSHSNVNEETLALIIVHKRFPLDLIGAIINAGGLIGLALVLTFLWTATKARRPELSPSFRILAILGGGLAAVSAVIYEIVISVVSNQFVTSGQQTYAQAHHLTSSPIVLALPTIAFFGDLLLAVAIVTISLNAMRVGLLPRVMGYLGIFVGVLFLFPIGSPVPVIQAGWMCALAYLFLGRWPNAYPPAWERGEVVPWPSNQKAREQQVGRPARGGRGKPVPKPQPAATAERAVAPAAGSTRATTPKRKRKRRS